MFVDSNYRPKFFYFLPFEVVNVKDLHIICSHMIRPICIYYTSYSADLNQVFYCLIG